MTGPLKMTVIKSPRWGSLIPHDEHAELQFERIPVAKPVMITLTQPRNPGHLAKLWLLAARVANFHPAFLDADDAVRWAKIKLKMFKSWTLADGRLAIELDSLAVESMDQLAFAEFYDRCLKEWAAEIGCDPEELLR